LSGVFVRFSLLQKQLAEFVKNEKKEKKLILQEFAERAGVALTVIFCKLNKGKTDLNMDKVNLVLRMLDMGNSY
jgi:predicted transcriptional regulator